MNFKESPLFVDLIKKLAAEVTRATTDASASVETSPIKDLLTSFEKADFSKIDFGSLLGSLLGGGSGLGGLMGSIGSLTKAFGLGASADSAGALSDVAAAGRNLAALNPADLTPERSRLVGILGKAIDFVKTQV